MGFLGPWGSRGLRLAANSPTCRTAHDDGTEGEVAAGPELARSEALPRCCKWQTWTPHFPEFLPHLSLAPCTCEVLLPPSWTVLFDVSGSSACWHSSPALSFQFGNVSPRKRVPGCSSKACQEGQALCRQRCSPRVGAFGELPATPGYEIRRTVCKVTEAAGSPLCLGEGNRIFANIL